MNTKYSHPAERISELITPELLECLEEIYPIRQAIPSTSTHIEATWMAAGRQELIDFLRACYERRDHSPNVPRL